MIAKAEQFLREDIWRLEDEDLPKAKAFFIRILKVLLIALRGFNEDKISLRASALTFYSLLSVVPVVAMAFGISKGFGLDNKLKQELINSLPGQESVADWLIQFAESFLENTKGYFIAGMGLILLFWSVLKVLGNIEDSFNAIWQIKKSRSWFRKIADYLVMMLVAPILMITASSATVFITTKIANIAESHMVLGAITPFLFFLIKLIPYISIWLLFTMIYMVMPNTKVNFKSALIGGIIAGTVFAFTQWLYIRFQVGVSRYNAIYGSFAALPLFIVWMQTSWLIVLFGTELSFGDQNIERYQYEPDILNLNFKNKKIVSLIITHFLVNNFELSKKPSTATEISRSLKIPIRLVRDIIYDLNECSIINEVNTEYEKERAYQPSFDIHKLTVSHVLESLENKGLDKIVAEDSKLKEDIIKLMDEFNLLVNEKGGKALIKDL